MSEAVGARIADVARGWVGTPFHHRAALRGVGCDCLGLVMGVWRELGCAADVELPHYAPEGPEVGHETVLVDGLRKYLTPLGGGAIGLGDVIAFRMRAQGPVQHLGIVTDAGETGAFVHAYSRQGVVESRLSTHWQSRIEAAFRMPVRGG